MRKTAVLLALVLISAIFAIPARAHRGHARPQITRFRFVDRPLKAGTSERLIVIAHDPDSWISKIQVQWEDANQSGGVIFAHTYCVQDPRRSFPDPDDTKGPLDVLIAEHRIGGDEQGLENHLVHTLTMADDLGPSPLAGAEDHVEFSFDTDGDASAYERTLLVDAGKGGILSEQIKDADGTVVGDASVTADGAVLSVDFAKRLLGRGTDRYRWLAVTHDASSPSCTPLTPCQDRAPDAGTYLHVM